MKYFAQTPAVTWADYWGETEGCSYRRSRMWQLSCAFNKRLGYAIAKGNAHFRHCRVLKNHLRATTSQYRLDHFSSDDHVQFVHVIRLAPCSRCNNTFWRVCTWKSRQRKALTKAGLLDPEHEGSLTLCYSIIQCRLSLHVGLLDTSYITIIYTSLIIVSCQWWLVSWPFALLNVCMV